MIHRFLVVFSLLVFLSACKSSESLSIPQGEEAFALPPSIFEKDTMYSFLTEIIAYDRVITGILRIKKVGEAQYKVVFSNESGFQLMALSFTNGKMESHQVFKKLDKKIILNTLEQGIQLLFYHSLCNNVYREKIENSSVAKCAKGKLLYRYYTYDNGNMLRIEVLKKEALVKWVEFQSYVDGLPQEIQINHEDIHLSYNLKAIKNG